MSALDNIMVCGLLRNKDRKALAEKAKTLLKKVEIGEGDWDKFPTQMSGGQQQRVAVVRGVINSPEVLFADEPTGALNSKASMEVLNELVKANEAGSTVLMVTHSEKVAASSDRIIYLMDGDIQGELILGKLSNAADTREELAKRERKLRNWLEEMGW
jgi:putative ABC transport system ATP-binding protein